MTAASTDYWPSTSEQSQEPPRPFWHRELFYQRPDTSKSPAEEPWAREVHMEDRKAWRMAEASRVPLSFTSNSKLIPHLPFPHQPENRQGWDDGFLGALHNLRVCEANLNAGEGTLVFTPSAFDYLGDCQYFALSFFHLEIIEKKILTKPWPTGSVYNAWFIDVKTGHDKIVTCLRSEKDAEDKIIHGQVYVPSELQIDT